MAQSNERRKLFVVADEVGLYRDERIALAEYLLRRDVKTWKDLTEDQVRRLLDAFDGWHLINELLAQRP